MSGPLGATSKVYEKDITLAVSRQLKAELERRGIIVVMTRKSDTLIALSDRGRIANHAKGDLFLSVHVNAANPRWKQPGGVVYQYVDDWVGRPMVEPDPAAIVRRYLTAYGPAAAADVTSWSGVPGMPAVLAAMDDLVPHTDASGKKLFDVPTGVLVLEDTPAPVRLLGLYDNVWLSHAGRDRVTHPDKRKRWMGVNGGLSSTVFVDGWLEGLWRVEDGKPVVVELFRSLTRKERSQLDEELDRVSALLAR